MNRASYWTADENSAPTHPTVGTVALHSSRRTRRSSSSSIRFRIGERQAEHNPDHTPDQESSGWLWTVVHDRKPLKRSCQLLRILRLLQDVQSWLSWILRIPCR